MWHDLGTPRRRPSITIQATFPSPKIHLMCLKLLYNALGGLYMCWAHFICSYISQGEFSVELMGAVHSEWVTCGDKWAHGSKPGSWIIMNFRVNSLLFHFYLLPIYCTFTMQWTCVSLGSSFILTWGNWLTCILKTENRYNFFPPSKVVSGSIFSLSFKLLQPLEYQLKSIPLI